MKKINVIVIGSGAYVCGKNTVGFGTILPSLVEATRNKLIDNITIVSKHASTKKIFVQKIKEIQKMTGIKIKYDWFLKNGKSEDGYKDAIKKSDKDTVIIVAVPDHLHYKITKFALQNTKHVLVVKPLVNKIREANELLKIAKKNNLISIVDFHKRYDLANIKLREMILNKKIGDPQYFHVEYSQRKEIPLKIFKMWAEHSNIFQYLGVHYVDVISFVSHAKPIRVMALGQKDVLMKEKLNTYDSMQVVIEWQNGKKKFISTILCNWIDPNVTSAVSYQSIKVVGTKGRIESDQKNRGYQIISNENIEDINPYFNQNYSINNQIYFRGYGIDSILQFFKDTNGIINKKIEMKTILVNRPTFENTLDSVIVVEAVNKSIKQNGKWIYCKH
jgi:predicted dehydrogenase